MCGRATLAMEVSSPSIKAASATVAAINQGLVLGFHAYIAALSAGAPAVLVAILLRFLSVVRPLCASLIDAQGSPKGEICGQEKCWFRKARVLWKASLEAFSS